MKLKILYLNPNLPEQIRREIEDNYFDYITDNENLALIEVAPVEQPFYKTVILPDDSEELDKIVLPYHVFEKVIDELIKAIDEEDFETFILKTSQLVGG